MSKDMAAIGARIIASARDLFVRFGLAKVSVEDIARAVGMGKSSLYYHFKSKEDIFRAVLDQEVRTYKAKLEQALSAARTAQDRMRLYVATRMSAVKDAASVYSAFRDDYHRQHGIIERARERIDKYEVEVVRRILSEGVESGEFRVRDVGLTAITIVTAAKGLEYGWAVEQSDEESERNLSRLLEVLFHGIVRPR